MEVCSIFLCYSVFLLINYFFLKYITFIFYASDLFSTKYFMEYCQRLQNYRADMRQCRTQNRWQGEESGMSGVKTSIERIKNERSAVCLPDNLTLPNTNHLVIYQCTV